jgi:pimeloyl-ACP methyl ester carboxylesterase
MYRHTGVRGGPHLVAPGDDERARCIRLAVPVGLSTADVETAAARLVALFREPGAVSDLVAAGAADPALATYQPAERVPDDVRYSLQRGYRAPNENWEVLREHAAVERRLLRAPAGDVEVYEAGDGPVLLLLHPFNLGAGYFAGQFAGLAGRYRVVVVHHPGVGGTTAAADLTLDGMARQHLWALRELGVAGPVHVAGASFGSLLAQHIAVEHPDDVASLALICGSYRYANRTGEVNKLERVVEEDFDRLIAETGSKRMRMERERLTDLLVRCKSMNPQTGLRYLDLFAGQPDLLSRLARIAVPALIVQGRHDSVIPLKTAHVLHGAIPDSRYVEIPDAAHFACMTHPDEVNAALSAFLAVPS